MAEDGRPEMAEGGGRYNPALDRAREEQKPDRPSELGKRHWWQTLKRTVTEFKEDNMTDWAAALTYYGVLALFPALLVLVALVGLFGQHPQTTNALLGLVGQLGPPTAVETFRGPIEGVIQSKGGAGALLGVGLLGALWSASGYFGAFFRASNAVWDIEEGRPAWKLVPLRVVVTIVMVLLLAVVLMALVLTGPLAEAVGGLIGLGGVAVTLWQIAKWPVLLIIVMGMFAILYHVSPNVRHPGVRWVSPGGVVGVLVWIIASVAFAFYVANFGSYNKTYGSLGGMIVFFLWLWISNNALLLGAELDAELERSRQIRGGMPEGREPFMPPRDEPARS
jgi:membrane protein